MGHDEGFNMLFLTETVSKTKHICRLWARQEAFRKCVAASDGQSDIPGLE